MVAPMSSSPSDRSNRFGIEPGLRRIREGAAGLRVPIRTAAAPTTKAEDHWKDGSKRSGHLLVWLVDDCTMNIGHAISTDVRLRTGSMAGWRRDPPWIGQDVLEIGAGWATSA